jgi:hypothetical protein
MNLISGKESEWPLKWKCSERFHMSNCLFKEATHRAEFTEIEERVGQDCIHSNSGTPLRI